MYRYILMYKYTKYNDDKADVVPRVHQIEAYLTYNSDATSVLNCAFDTPCLFLRLGSGNYSGGKPLFKNMSEK